MKNSITSLVLGAGLYLLLLFGACEKASNQPLEQPLTSKTAEQKTGVLAAVTDNYVVMTFNIRLDAPDTGNRAWAVRRPLVKERIIGHDCDIVGVQEALGNQISNLETDLPGYARIGTGRDGNGTSEHSSIFFKTARFNLLGSGTFWLAPGAPVTATGPSWDAAYKRICTWVKVQDKETAMVFFVFNSHFDHKGSLARQNSADLILSQMQDKIGSAPALFMGDLNANQNSPAYNILNGSTLLEETWNLAASKLPALRVTGNGWNPSPTGDSQIDHIFVTGHWTVDSRLVDWYHKDPGAILPSDHFPVVSRLKVEGVTFFKDAQYGGTAIFLPKGNYTMTQLAEKGMPNDWASSLRVAPGRTVLMYEHDNFTGNLWTRTSDTPLFSALSPTANDKMTSVKVQ
ncbi:endonuclease/exonuclease/phosphatase family protein [Pedobacter nototheniae]|uniref:endonuclease/exonuclease/phosphatase family protein n=1 Tax=Pedobacter nototheniae TaxID=2488994 RepID=UPI00103C0B67|nr:endonuclease/exonuclease/phosphatase family protein [Pedobacter nototheniae]